MICVNQLWKASLAFKESDSDYEWEPANPNNGEKVQDMAKVIRNVDQSIGITPPSSPPGMAEKSPDCLRIPSPMGAFPVCLEAGYSQQLLSSPEKSVEQRDSDELFELTDRPQEDEHYRAKRGLNSTSTLQETCT